MDGGMQQLAEQSRHESLRCGRLGSWTYLQWATLRVLPDTRSRARWLRQLLLPDMRHLRERYGSDGAPGAVVVSRRMLDGVRRLWGYL